MGDSYDKIYQSFLDNCGYDFDELPSTNDMRYRLIENSIKLYNQKAKKYETRINGNIICDSVNEVINKTLNDVELLILSNMMAYILNKNKLVEFVSIYSVFSKEMGISNYKAQVTAREEIIKSYKEEFERLIEDEIDSFSL